MDYLKIMEIFFPEEPVSCTGSFSTYSDLVFSGTPRTEIELDALWVPVLKIEADFKIDKRTSEILKAGFSFDSKSFGVELEDRVNYGHIDQFKDMLEAIGGFPFDLSTLDGSVYSLDLVDLPSFVGGVLFFVNSTFKGGNDLKDLVNNCTTEAELNNLPPDNR